MNKELCNKSGKLHGVGKIGSASLRWLSCSFKYNSLDRALLRRSYLSKDSIEVKLAGMKSILGRGENQCVIPKWECD